MDIFSRITATAALIIGAVAGLIVGGLLCTGATVFYYRGLSLPLPFTERRVTVFAGEIGREMKSALKGYVAETQLAALQGRLDEVTRQKQAADYAHASFTKQVAADQAKDAAETASLQQENDAYAAALRASNRACDLDQHDLDFLMR